MGDSNIRYKGDILKHPQIISASLTGNEGDNLEPKLCLEMLSGFHQLSFN